MHGQGGDYKDLVVFLAAAGVIVPLVNRLKVSPVLGFLAAGVLLGPDGLGRFAQSLPWLSWLTIGDPGQLAQLSELGVAFLLFMIGLELSWDRLKIMRTEVFWLGTLQVFITTIAFAAAARRFLHQPSGRVPITFIASTIHRMSPVSITSPPAGREGSSGGQSNIS